jgi:8-amino-7-oxononanoate synthase
VLCLAMTSQRPGDPVARGSDAPPGPAAALPDAFASRGTLPSAAWDTWLHDSISSLHGKKLLRSLRPVVATDKPTEVRSRHCSVFPCALRLLPGFASCHAQVIVPHTTYAAWLNDTPSVGEHVPPGGSGGGAPDSAGVRVRLFSTNDYLGLSSHQDVRQAYGDGDGRVPGGSGPRASALVAGYTDAHRALEADLAEAKHTEECLLFPTGFAANTSVIQARVWQ